MRTIDEIIKPYLQTFTNQELPPAYKPMQIGRCYYNAYVLASKNPSLIYCEGIFNQPQYGTEEPHAFVVDPSGRVIDPTYPYDPNRIYSAVPFKSTWVIKVFRDADLADTVLYWHFQQLSDEHKQQVIHKF